MKVLHVIPSISERSGGPGQAILPMCRALLEHGVDVLLASTTADLGDVSERDHERVFMVKGMPVILFRKQFGNSYKYSRPFSRWLSDNVSNYDLVHIHAVFNHACIAAARECREKGVPYVVRPLGTLDPWSMGQKSLRKKIFWHAVVKTMLTHAAAIHYTSQGEQQAVEESLGLNHGVVVPLGFDVSMTEAASDASDLPQQPSTLPAGPYVLVLSRLLPTKGLDVLLDAFLSLVKLQAFQNWCLVLAGEGPPAYVASLKRIVEKRNAAESVIFTGWLDGGKKESALRNASLLALPSYHENFGLCVIEALAFGVPVLISPHVGLASEIEAVGAGWVTSVGKEALEASLSEALANKTERTRRGKAGIDLAKAFSWQKVTYQLKELYGSILSEQQLPKASQTSDVRPYRSTR